MPRIDLLALTAEQSVELLEELLPLIPNEAAMESVTKWAAHEGIAEELAERLAEED